MKEIPFDNLPEVADILAAEYSAVVHDLLSSIADDETIRELVTESAVALASSAAEPGPGLVRRLAATLVGNADSVQAGGPPLTPEEKARWDRCLLANAA
jgi:hypothetical protein